MWLNYLKVSLRGFLRNRLFSFINVAGLAIGLAGVMLIGLFVWDELSFDQHYADADRIFRVSRDIPNQGLFLAGNAPMVAPLLKQDFPGIEFSARLIGGRALLSRDGIAYYEDMRFADNEFFDIFALDWLTGNPAQALTRPYTVVLSESMALKYFGTGSAMGQTLLLENMTPLEVTGVISDLSHNTHLNIDLIASLETLVEISGTQVLETWGNSNFHTYIKLRSGVAIESIASQFPAFLDRHFRENSSAYNGMTAMNVGDIHLYSTRQFEMSPPGSIANVRLFSAVACFVLLIACFNYMNLSTSRSASRGQEVGIRKTLGASRSQIARQFIGESVLVSILASLLALVLVELALPGFNALLGKSLELKPLASPAMLLVLLVLAGIVGLFAGSYSALFVSAFRPVQIFRNTLPGGGSPLLRQMLVVLQFAIAIVLVVATLVVMLQMRFARNIEPGFQKEQMLLLSGSPTAGLGPQWETLRQELLRHPDILAVTTSVQTPLQNNGNTVGIAEAESQGRTIPVMLVGDDFFDAYDIPLLAGRGFSADFPADRVRLVGDETGGGESGLVLNRLAVEQFGWTPEEAIGKALYVFFDSTPRAGKVVGVVENSYFESVHNNIKAMLFVLPEPILGRATMSQASLRLTGRNLQDTLAHVDRAWEQFMPDFPLSRAFLDERFDAFHLKETRLVQLLNTFALLAIFIACMGLVGLASFNAERRRKEVGIRKVMGGSVWSIVLLLTNDFSKLVLISNLIAWPIAYVAMQRWLESFAYRIDLTPMVFIGSGLIALCVAWVTVGGTAAKAASAKPVLALRYE